MIKIGVIGYGYWGPNLVRNFMAAPGSAVMRVCDLRKERLSSLGKLYPGLKTCTDSSELINEATARNLVLLVDHTFVYTDAVRKIRELISSGQLGEIYYYDAVRVNLG